MIEDKDKPRNFTLEFKLDEVSRQQIKEWDLDAFGVKLLIESFIHNYISVWDAYFDYRGVTFHIRKHQWARKEKLEHSKYTEKMLSITGINPFAAKLVADSFLKAKHNRLEFMVHGVVVELRRAGSEAIYFGKESGN